MMSSRLATWQEMNKFRKENDVVYGVYQGCGFTVTEEDGGTLFVFMLSPTNDSSFDAFEGALVNVGGTVASGQVGDVENYLAIFFDSMISASEMDRVLDFVVANAKGNGFRVPNVCVKCGARATKRSFVDDMVQPLCAECSAKVKQQRASGSAAKPIPKPTPAPTPYDDQTSQYAQQYAPIQADSSKYDENYDEYAGMEYQPNQNPDSFVYGSNYSSGGGNPNKMSFSDPDDYNDVMGGKSFDADNDTKVAGNMGMGVLGALLGSLLGVVLYLVVALVAKFPMGALCCTSGMLAVVLYTVLGGEKSKSVGMGMSIAFSTVVSAVTVFVTSVMTYSSGDEEFSAALNTLMSDPSQKTLFVINIVLASLGAIFGACFFINIMDKYVANDNSEK